MVSDMSNRRAPCEVCRDRQTIRLPLHKMAVAASFYADAPPEIAGPSHRDYPCPECAPLAPKEKVRVVECHFQADTRHEADPRYREHLVKNAARAIGDAIEEMGLMRLQSATADSHELTRGYRVTVGVVAPKVIADLDAERQAAEQKFATSVVEIAIKDIDNWGSYYGNTRIDKDRAADFLREALKKADRKRPR
jgi:hypothetical protein